MSLTSEDIAQWMLEQLSAAHQTNDYAQISVEINGHDDKTDPQTRFSVYMSSYKHARDMASIDDCFEHIRKLSPLNQAQIKRAQAAALLTQAEELEATA